MILTPKFDFPKPEGTDPIAQGYDAISDLADGVEALIAALFPHRADAGPAPAPTPYTPVWTAPTTNPVIGNGTIAGSWFKIERLVFWFVSLGFGSTTTQGSGLWSFTLPPAAGTYGANANGYGGRAALVDASAAVRVGRDILYNTATQFCLLSEAGVYVQSGSPWAWANGDTMHARGIAIADS